MRINNDDDELRGPALRGALDFAHPAHPIATPLSILHFVLDLSYMLFLHCYATFSKILTDISRPSAVAARTYKCTNDAV